MRTVVAAIFLLSLVFENTCHALEMRGAWVDPSLCQDPSPTPPGHPYKGVYRDRLDRYGKPVCYESGGNLNQLMDLVMRGKN